MEDYFRLTGKSAGVDGAIDVTTEVHCSSKFLKNLLVGALLDLNDRCNDAGMIIKNGLWLDIQDSVNYELKKRAGLND